MAPSFSIIYVSPYQHVFSPVLWLKSVDVTSHLPWWRWVTTGSLIFSLRRVARVATLVFSFTGRPAIGMAATWDGLICFDYFDLLFVDVCCLGCLWICFSETGKKHVLYRVATLSSLTLRPTSYDLRQHCSKTHHSSDPKG